MRRLFIIPILLSAFIGPSRAEDSPIVLRLSSGKEVIGRLQEFDADVGIVMTRSDNGGTLTLSWEQIREEDVVQIRRAHGYVDDEPATITISASRITFTNGRSQVGVITENKNNAIILKTRGTEVEIARSRIQAIDAERVDALSVYSSDELYQENVAENPPETPLQHYNVGVFCESIERYDLALSHFQTAAELDPDFQREEVAGKIRVCDIKDKAKDQTLRLNEIKQLTFRKEYGRAQSLSASFDDDFSDADPQLVGEAQQLGLAALKAQTNDIKGRVSSDFLLALDEAVRRLVRKPEITLKVGLQYMRDQASDDIFDAIARKYEIDRPRLDELWADREIKRPLTRSYGDGTFILGPDALVQPEKKVDAQDSETPEDKPKTWQDRIDEIIKNRDKNQKNPRRGGGNKGLVADVGLTPDQWYAQASGDARRYLLMAYFGENTEWLTVHRVTFRDCSLCNGVGRVQTISRDQERGRETDYCPRCKGLKLDRIVDIK